MSLLLLILAFQVAAAHFEPGLQKDAVTCADNPPALSYHAHVLFWSNDPASVKQALDLQKAFDAEFHPHQPMPDCVSVVSIFNGADGPDDVKLCALAWNHSQVSGATGPFLTANYAWAFNVKDFGPIVAWLMHHRPNMTDVFVHPNTGCQILDHIDKSLWIGKKWEIDTNPTNLYNALYCDRPGCDGVMPPQTCKDQKCYPLPRLPEFPLTRPPCEKALETACPSGVSSRCPVCVVNAWPTLEQGSCSEWTLGVGVKRHCKPDNSTWPTNGTGMFKSTWAVSDPVHTTWPLLMKYLPVVNTWDSCSENHCKCGATGRTEMVNAFFGIHTVFAAGLKYARASPPYSGSLSLKEVEQIVDNQLGGMSVYSPWMDYNLALWAPEGTLDTYVDRFASDGVPVLRLSWACGEVTCYSVIWHIPKSQVVIEIMSNQTSRPTSQWKHVDEERHHFIDGTPPDSDYMKPLHDSRAVTNISKIISFYHDIMLVEPLKVASYANGLKVVSFAYPTDPYFRHNATLQYVERPVPSGSLGSEAHSTAWFERYQLDVSKKYMHGSEPSSNTCWPIWGDNHQALRSTTSIDEYKARLDAKSMMQYHDFIGQENGVPGFGHTSFRFTEPSGYEIEVTGVYNNPPKGTDRDTGDFEEYCIYHCGAKELLV